MSDLPERVYYDVTVVNIDSKDNKRPTRTVFNQTRSTPFISDPSKYYLSILRWTLDSFTLPLFIPQMSQTAGVDGHDANETAYTVTMSYNDFIVRRPMLFIPQDKSAEEPIAPGLMPNGIQQNNGGYYNVYSTSYVIYLVNNCIKECFNELSVLSGDTLPTDNVPFLTFDVTTNIAVMNLPEDGFGTNTVGGAINVYFNTLMAGLFSSFPYEINYTSSFGRNFKFLSDVLGVSTVAAYPPNANPVDQYDVIQIYQEISTVESWNPVASLAVMSNTLGVIQNIEGTPTVFYDNIVVNGTGNNSVSSNLITDFVADSYRPSIIYVPSSEYRRIQLTGNTPLNNLDIALYWKDKLGRFYDFYLPSGGAATLKLMFELKD